MDSESNNIITKHYSDGTKSSECEYYDNQYSQYKYTEWWPNGKSILKITMI